MLRFARVAICLNCKPSVEMESIFLCVGCIDLVARLSLLGAFRMQSIVYFYLVVDVEFYLCG